MDLQTFLDRLFTTATNLAFRLLGGLALLIIGRLLIKWVLRLLKNSKGIKKIDTAAERFLINAVNVALNLLLAASVVAVLGVPMTSVLALLTSAGVAIGLALQGALGNLAGGIMILIFHPFHLNDFVEIENFSGTVVDIGLFYTTLKTPDNRSVTIPNGTVMGEEIINYSANDHRRVDLTFSVAYGNIPSKIIQTLLEESEKNPFVLKEPSPFCKLAEQGDSSMNFILRVWVAKNDYWTVKFELLEAVHNRLTADGISVPYKQLDVHLKHHPTN